MPKKETTATTVKRGRPVVEGSKRQAVLAMREAKRASGIEIKRGRPKMTKVVSEEKVSKAPKAVKIKVKAEPVNVADDIKAMFTDEETIAK